MPGAGAMMTVARRPRKTIAAIPIAVIPIAVIHTAAILIAVTLIEAIAPGIAVDPVHKTIIIAGTDRQTGGEMVSVIASVIAGQEHPATISTRPEAAVTVISAHFCMNFTNKALWCCSCQFLTKKERCTFLPRI